MNAAGRTKIEAGDIGAELCQCMNCGRMHRRLGDPPWCISYADACRLSQVFSRHAPLRDADDLRINEWLKCLLTSLRRGE